MAKHILLTGGTGLIGKNLTRLLLDSGYKVSHLSRTPGKNPKVKTYLWNITKGEIDEACIDGVDTIIHLAGAGIADKRWTDDRKKELIESRTKSIGLVYKAVRNRNNKIKTVISASAVGYYSDRGDELLDEDSAPANDFLGTCCVKWEAAVDEGLALGMRIVKYRTGVVLDKNAGALPQLALPVKLGVGSPLGKGTEWVSWIHLKDVIDMYLYAVENPKVSGTFNMAAPAPVTNKELTAAVAKKLHRPLWAPNVPAFLIKLLFGEMGSVVLGSTRVSVKKILDVGFKFEYSDLKEALQAIYDR